MSTAGRRMERFARRPGVKLVHRRPPLFPFEARLYLQTIGRWRLLNAICESETSREKTVEKTVKTRHVTLPIGGLGCGGGGALTVERALAQVSGVARVYVNPLTEMAYVDFDPAVTDCQALVIAVKGVGFEAGRPTIV